jgi:plastocyanin
VTLGSITVTPSSVDATAGEIVPLTVDARDTNGSHIQGSIVTTFASTDDAVALATVDGDVIGIDAGSTTIHVSVSLNGVTKSVDVPVVVSGALQSQVDVIASATDYVFTPATAVVAEGGTVTWHFGALAHTVTFLAGQPNAPASIGPSYNITVTRSFPVAGTFSYECSIHAGMSGQVVVH